MWGQIILKECPSFYIQLEFFCIVIYIELTMVVVAQLVEPRVVVPVVAGSSPVYHPFIKPA